MKSLSKNNRFLYWAQIIVVGLVVGIGIQVVQAWTGPSMSAPNGNVAGPLTTSGVQQTKSGNLILGNDLAVSRNAVLGSYVSTSNTLGLCLSGVCHTTWASVLSGVTGGGVTSITGGSGISVNQSTGNVTVSVNPSTLAAALFGSATLHTCNLYDYEGSSKNCNIGTKNMCFLVNVFGRDGDDVDGFGCSVVGSPGGNWYLRAVGEDFAQTYCQAQCI